MAGDKKITVFFYFFIILLFAQFAYGLVVRECYPGFMMPGFSRIDNNGKEYVTYDYILWYETEQAQRDTINLVDFASPLSKIALGRAIDLAFFPTSIQETYNGAQKKYYRIIKSLIGEQSYQRNIISVRNPKMSQEQIDEFSAWVKTRIAQQQHVDVERVHVEKISITRDFISGDTLSTALISDYDF